MDYNLYFIHFKKHNKALVSASCRESAVNLLEKALSVNDLSNKKIEIDYVLGTDLKLNHECVIHYTKSKKTFYFNREK